MTEPAQDKAWHLDKRVPIALIITFVFTILGQTVGVVWWARGLDARVDGINDRVRELEAAEAGRPQRRDAIQQQLSDIKSQMSALNERSKSTVESVGEVKRAVELLTQKFLDAAKK